MNLKPKSVSVSLQAGQIQKLRDLAKVRAEKDELTSRSAIIRQALNLGLAVLILREQGEEQGARSTLP